MHVKSKDTVIVISGKDKGKKGKISAAFPKLNRVTVEGVNVVTKHQKARNAAAPGGIIHKEMPIDASNVMLVCPKCGKPTRVNNKAEKVTDENGDRLPDADLYEWLNEKGLPYGSSFSYQKYLMKIKKAPSQK